MKPGEFLKKLNLPLPAEPRCEAGEKCAFAVGAWCNEDELTRLIRGPLCEAHRAHVDATLAEAAEIHPHDRTGETRQVGESPMLVEEYLRPSRAARQLARFRGQPEPEAEWSVPFRLGDPR